PCPKCGTMISKDAIVCYACGAEVKPAEEKKEEAGAEEIPCPKCGTMISKDAIVCYACGAEVKPAEEQSGDVVVKKVVKKRII
ncbi:MAG: double zinc ribbon domain-containing protein, partial [Thermoplasmata archaeon]